MNIDDNHYVPSIQEQRIPVLSNDELRARYAVLGARRNDLNAVVTQIEHEMRLIHEQLLGDVPW
jgi:hypothetical protein